MTDRTCDLPDCDKPRYQTRDLCASHYMKRWRYGDPYYVAPSRAADLTGRRFGALVVIERDGRKWSCSCDCGGRTSVRVGDLNRGSVTSCGDRAKHWRAETATNAVAHQRVRSDRGRAADYPCVDCGGPAKHWSYDHTDPNELPDAERGPYSLDVNRYHPRCIPCHKRFDLKHIAEVAA